MFFFFQAEDGIRDLTVTGVQTCALPILISAAGQARFKPLDELSDADFRFSLDNKLLGQVNVIRYGLGSVADNGSITITSGVLAQQPMRGSGALSLLNAGLEGLARAAALR